VGLALGWYLYFLAAGTLAPGVTIGGQDFAGMTAEQAVRSLDAQWNDDFRLLAIDAGEPSRFWSIRPAEIGLGVDAEATARAALRIGRGSNPVEGALQLLQSLRGGWDAPPLVRFDAEAGRSGLIALAPTVDIQSVDGSVAVADGQVARSDGRMGRALSVEATLALVAADPASILLTYQFIPLVMDPVAPEILDVSEAAEEIQRILDSAPILSAYDPVTGERFQWTPARNELAAWVRVVRSGRAFEVDVDPALVRGYVEGLNAGLGDERTLSLDTATAALLGSIEGRGVGAQIIHYLPTTRVVGPADTWISIGAQVGMPYWKVQEANPQAVGRGFRSGETITIPPRDALLPLPVIADKRIVISISEQRLYVYEDGELLSEHVVSTGIARSPTLPGIFQVQSHEENAYASNWDLWMPHFLGIYEAVPGFWNGIHGLPLLSNGVRLWANVLGRPASFGCIILPLDEAEWLYGWAEEGVVVEIRR
jgi:lipoprotein-anchoring transpeptidase ErfK/SrfK